MLYPPRRLWEAVALVALVALVVLLRPAPALAEGEAAVERAPAPRTWRAAMILGYGALRRPSECTSYCQDAYGPSLAIWAGRMVTPRLAVVGEGWLFQREALAAMLGAQLWLGEEAGWLRGGAGVMSTSHHNADGGGGDGTGPALSLSAGARLSCFEPFSTELSARVTAVTHDLGVVTSFTVGYGLAW